MATTIRETFSNEEIIEEIRRGNSSKPDMIRFIYQKQGRGGYDYVLRESKDPEKAKEVLQSAIFSFVLQVKKGKLQAVDNLKAYLTRACRNIWLNYNQKKRPESRDMNEFVEIVVSRDLASDHVERKERVSLIREIMEMVKEDCRQIFSWSIVEERSMDWIARQLNLSSAQAAMNKKSRCKERFVKAIHANATYSNLVKQLLIESHG